MHRLKITQRAEKDLKKLAPTYRAQIASSIRDLGGEPRPIEAMKLTNREEWRLRQGDYRILYTIDDDAREITIIRIKHRREAYR